MLPLQRMQCLLLGVQSRCRSLVRCSNIYPRCGTVLSGARRCPQESKCWGLSAQAPSAVGVSTSSFKLRLRGLVLRPILSMKCMHLCREICRVKSDLWSDLLLNCPKRNDKRNVFPWKCPHTDASLQLQQKGCRSWVEKALHIITHCLAVLHKHLHPEHPVLC